MVQPSHFNPTPRGIHGTLLLVTKCPFFWSKRCFPRGLWCPSSISSTIACLCTYTTTTLHDPRFKDRHAWPRLEKTRSRTPLDSLLGCVQGHFNPCDRPRSTLVPRQPTGDAGRPVRVASVGREERTVGIGQTQTRSDPKREKLGRPDTSLLFILRFFFT